MALARRRRPQDPCDLWVGDFHEDMVGPTIMYYLSHKGFCVTDMGIQATVLNEAAEEARQLENLGRFNQPPSMIAEGLLGSEGSAQVAELKRGVEDGETLRSLKDDVAAVAKKMQEYGIGPNFSHLSEFLIHLSGSPSEEVPLSAKEAYTWLGLFERARIVAILFLGPSKGTIELCPYFEDSEPFDVKVFPGMMLMVRSDIMSHRLYSREDSYTLTSYFLEATTPGAQVPKSPVYEELNEWVNHRMKEFKDKETDSSYLDPEVPRHWRLTMNRMLPMHKGQTISVQAMSCRYPNCWVMEDTFGVSLSGPDYATSVPTSRWDHTKYYDSTPESWRQMKTETNHGSFMEGTDLFDPKIFSLAPAEVKGMDPAQRIILDVCYESLRGAGYKKNTMMNLHCGVYVGVGNSEWNYVPKDGVASGCGSALSIHANRVSFCLGMKGASMALDTEAASGLCSLYQSAESVQLKGTMERHVCSLAVGIHLQLDPIFWAQHSAAGWLSKKGRCLVHDVTADGHVRCDGAAACAMKRLKDLDEGDRTSKFDMDEFHMGFVASAVMNHSGMGASLSSPSGPAEQEAISEACRNAGISKLDVDGVEAHATGSYLSDAVEVASVTRGHRTLEEDDPLPIMSQKSSFANTVEYGGLSQFLRSLQSAARGVLPPSIHLRVANPHIDLNDTPSTMVPECAVWRMDSSYIGTLARGFGGSNVYALGLGRKTSCAPEKENEEHVPSVERPAIVFWPGGGGELDSVAEPKRCYTIVGSFNEWKTPQDMVFESPGVYTCVVTLGEDNWGQFQIWLDGESDRVLHPDSANAQALSEVLGPNEGTSQDFCWCIDGRFEGGYDALEGEVASTADASGTQEKRTSGNQFRVILHVTGKWRTVTWQAVEPERAADADMGTPAREDSIYYVSGNWNNWMLQEMTADGSALGIFHYDAKMLRRGGEFQIIRDKDWNQVIYPATPKCRADSDAPAQGPSSDGHGLNWFLNGSPRDIFRIRLACTMAAGKFVRNVSWEKIRTDDVEQPMPEVSSEAAKYSIVGTWDNWMEATDMKKDGERYMFYLELGSEKEASFQILKDGRREQTLYPSRPDSGPRGVTTLLGLGILAQGLHWTIGKHPEDAAEVGACYQVTLDTGGASAGVAGAVTWEKLAPGTSPSETNKSFFKSLTREIRDVRSERLFAKFKALNLVELQAEFRESIRARLTSGAYAMAFAKYSSVQAAPKVRIDGNPPPFHTDWMPAAEPEGKPRLVFLGDSITMGSPAFFSASFTCAIAERNPRLAVENAGWAGLFSAQLARPRGHNTGLGPLPLPNISEYKCEYACVMIGTNDAIAMCLNEEDAHANYAVTNSGLRGLSMLPSDWREVCNPSFALYETSLRSVLRELVDSGAKVAVATPPPIGEDLTGTLDPKMRKAPMTVVSELAAIVHRVAIAEGCTVLPVFECMTHQLKVLQELGREPVRYSRDYSLEKLNGYAAEVSESLRAGRSNPFFDDFTPDAVYLFDAIHYNETGAALHAALVQLWLDSIP